MNGRNEREIAERSGAESESLKVKPFKRRRAEES